MIAEPLRAKDPIGPRTLEEPGSLRGQDSRGSIWFRKKIHY